MTEAPSPKPRPPKRQIWSDTHISALTEGTMPDAKIQEALRSRDSRGMDPTSYAVLRTARRTESLTALLSLLDPPETAEQTQLDQVVMLLEAIAESQTRMESRMVSLESRLAASSWASAPPSVPAKAGSRS